LYIERLYIDCYHSKNKVENLPSTLKEIIIEYEDDKKYIKIPFGTILTIKKFYKN
jgi:hypothetical protein